MYPEEGDSMKFKWNIFSKIVTVIFIFLIPILLLYGVSNQVSVQVVESLLQKEKQNQLGFLNKQMDAMVYTLAMSTVTLLRDPTVLELEKMLYIGDEQGATRLEATVQEKLNLQSSASSWYNDITLNFPAVQKKLSTGLRQSLYNEQQLEHNSRLNDWIYQADLQQPGESKLLYYAGGPLNERAKINQNVVIVETAFYEKNIASLLDQLKSGSKGDPFMVDRKHQVIYNRTSDQVKTKVVVDALSQQEHHDNGSLQTQIDGKTYLINFIYSQPLGFYIVDYTPMQQILSPITASRNLFYSCIVLLLVVGFMASFLLYKHVQLPLHALIGVLKRFQSGDFGVRIQKWYNNEFDFVFIRFNDMAGQIQHLFENVYEERNRSRLATLKLLQAQINPHFLYNCLNFIISSANLGRHEPVTAMAYNLSDYYRYMTRLEDHNNCLKDELQLVKTFLEIHRLRFQRIEYEIKVPEEMLNIPLPRLLIQPLVENAVIHGLEPKMVGGRIVISGAFSGDHVSLTIEDNGVGISEKKLQSLRLQLDRPMDEEIGCGMWNVNQRLKHLYGESASLDLVAQTELSGLRIVLTWKEKT
jgi:two-component system sensor histidine kinase YesM